jgi:hypothetical protein
MAISYINTGSIATGINVDTTVVPPSYQTGDALLYFVWEHMGTDSMSAPAGWQQLSNNATITTVTIWGRIAQSTSETIPTFNWATSNRGFGCISVFRGVDTGFTSVVGGTSERGSNVTQNIVGAAGARTPTQPGSLCVIAGARNKTSTSNGSVYTKPTGWDGMLYSNVPAGTDTGGAAAYWIQTTATATAANTTMNGSIADGVAQTMNATMIFLAPAVSSGGGGGGTGTVAFPPPKRKTYVYYDLYYPR